jgi:chromosomal replication initiation ATPase DnaA
VTQAKDRQLAFDLALRPALGREDFLVAPSNAKAVALIDAWPKWPGSTLLVLGQPGSGKTHLAEVWRALSGAARIEGRDLDETQVPVLLASGGAAVEDIPESDAGERALFHLLNLAREQKGHALITSRDPPQVRLPDLQSRLKAAPVVHLGLPDDELLRGVLVKLFADRQIAVDESVIAYLVLRMPRSLEAAREFVAEVDRRALEEKADVTRAFVAKVLGARA